MEPPSAPPSPMLLSELLAARLCHDLGGLVGTVAGALSVAVEEPSETTETVALAHEAAVETVRRIRLLRAAWGPLSDDIGAPTVRSLALGLPGRKVAMAFDDFDEAAPLSPAAARLLLNILLLAAESLPAGGTLTVQGGAPEIVVAIEGARAAWPAGFATMLVDEQAAWASLSGEAARSGRIQAAVTALFAHRDDLRLSMLLAGTQQAGTPPPLLLGAKN